MPAKPRIVTVTGAVGFVGRHVVQRLLDDGRFAVRCLVRPDSDVSALQAMSAKLQFVAGDITVPDTLVDAFQDSWGVINVAGYREFWSQDRDQFYALNERGARNVFEACLAAEVKKVLQVSTPLAFGLPDTLPFNEETPAGPHASDYARSKYQGDQVGWLLHREQGLPLTTVYLAAVIGAGDDKATMEVGRMVEGKLPALVGADTTYTYVYVRDAADAIFKALVKRNSVGQSYLIGNQRATTREYFTLIGQLAGVAVPKRNIPEAWLLPVARGMEWLARTTGKRPVLPIDVLKTTMAGSLLFDASRSIEALGMQYTPLQTALAEAVEELQQ
ncbi:NAD-dependent epimerase/dehydratase family protein [Candidatus Litorirhabdus singularis]|nr:NAD-dependent epimerase/dehydratase family protein [Candidatus Litorirhabdus singularis]